MSLYGGISFKGKEAQPIVPKVESTNGSGSGTASPAAAPAPTTDSVEKQEEKPKSASWSAALRFAPVIRKKAPSSTPSIPAAFRSAFASADEASGQSQGARLVGHAKSALSTPTPPTIARSPSFTVSASTPVPGPSAPSPTPTPTTNSGPRIGRISKPPPMTLDDDDVNGFKATAMGQKAANNAKKRNKKGKNKGGPMRDDPGLSYGEVTYDPARPCDYAGYKAYLITQREKRRATREAERRRERSYSGSSYSGSSDEVRSDTDDRTNKKARFFAPPSSYNEPSSDAPQLPVIDERPNPASAPKGETGEEAYLRRLAMSTGKAPAPTPTPPTPQVVAGPQAFPSFAPASAASSISSGPTFYPASTSVAVPTPPTPPSFVPSHSPSSFAPPPPSFVPPPFLPPTESFTPPPPTSDQANEAAAKAREIAQRLSKLAGMQPPTLPPPAAPEVVVPAEPDDRPFAERMMAKFGYKEGQGLGASESGMTSALSVSRPSQPSSKKGKNKSKEEEPTPTGMASIGKARGQIVDSTREQRLKDQTSQYGEPSRVVLLTNLCGVEDVDDDLSGEVAEEANKLGVVERCFVYLVPGESRNDEAVRIFLVMSGLAGGYNAVRQFDGRFFGGRVVKARFYDESAFNQGYHTL